MSHGSTSQFLYHNLRILLLLSLFLKRPNSRRHITWWLRFGQLPMAALNFGVSRSPGLLISIAQPTTSRSLASPRWIMLTSGSPPPGIWRNKVSLLLCALRHPATPDTGRAAHSIRTEELTASDLLMIYQPPIPIDRTLWIFFLNLIGACRCSQICSNTTLRRLYSQKKISIKSHFVMLSRLFSCFAFNSCSIPVSSIVPQTALIGRAGGITLRMAFLGYGLLKLLNWDVKFQVSPRFLFSTFSASAIRCFLVIADNITEFIQPLNLVNNPSGCRPELSRSLLVSYQCR
jgi:hypothetical protein